MNEEDQFDDEVDMYVYEFTAEDVYLIYECVRKRIETWEGSPARPAYEQEHLWRLRDAFYVGVLEHKFKHMK